MLFKFIFTITTLPALALCHLLSVKTLGQLPLGTWLESLIVRSNGDLLMTQMWPSATVYTIPNPAACNPKIGKLISIPSIHGILGIDRVPLGSGKPETFVVVGSNSTDVGKLTPGTFEAWILQFNHRRHEAKVKVKKISDMSKRSAFLNGVVSIPGVSEAVLVSDSIAGLVGRLDLSTGYFDTSAFIFQEMAPISNGAFGINGIKIRGGHLYWTNSNAAKIYRVAITSQGFLVEGANPQLVADLSKDVSFLDDFDFDTKGNIYAASNFDNSVVLADSKSGKWNTVVGGIHEMTVAGSTAVAFGNGKRGKKKMFVATSGALAMPVDGTKTEGAKVVSVDISS
ncbi:hypothetical protein FHETE_7111 [Fusarium heterosporum]|uniref:SMP-30/Gluconolactonase/LRE-like region domain-containing protein n=1 Tax=Fusarium heterosporum TaxID=42747 RepID=A0A8H5WNJ5_FUSHE|nr:hypothetical protein FHETE_7111 [Fusarium heterosporum]